ncbi:MAG: hypothetical protein QW761_02850 [Candidatus Aenigmatarchaeota archaeon]
MNKIPKFLQHALWSCNTKLLDLKRDKRYIISQILNYGTRRDVIWLLSNYNRAEIKEVLKRPARGIWWRRVLNFWTMYYNIKLDPETFENAIYEPNKIKEKYLKKD